MCYYAMGGCVRTWHCEYIVRELQSLWGPCGGLCCLLCMGNWVAARLAFYLLYTRVCSPASLFLVPGCRPQVVPTISYCGPHLRRLLRSLERRLGSPSRGAFLFLSFPRETGDDLGFERGKPEREARTKTQRGREGGQAGGAGQ